MRRNWQSAALAAALSGLTLHAPGADWYVDNQAEGDGSGASWSHAFTNLTQAISRVWGAGEHAGDTIWVRQADAAPAYATAVTLGAGYADGTPAAYNRIVGWSAPGYRSPPRLIGTGAPQVVFTLGAPGAPRHYYEIRGFDFACSSSIWNDWALKLTDASSNIRFMSNTCALAGFTSGDSGVNTNVLIQGNLMPYGCGIILGNDRDVRIIDNTLGEEGYSNAAIGLGSGYLDLANHRVAGNTILCQQGLCISGAKITGTVIERNNLSGTRGGAIYQDSPWCYGLVIRNNLIHDAGLYTADIGGHGVLCAGYNNRIYNNTFVNLFNVPACIEFRTNGSGNPYVANQVFNNLFVNAPTGILTAAGCVTTNGYNNFQNVTVSRAGAGVNVSLGDDHALDPRFWDPPNGDYTPQETNLLHGAAGVFAGTAAPGDDYFGTPRPTNDLAFGAVQRAPNRPPTLTLWPRTTFYRDERHATLFVRLSGLTAAGDPLQMTCTLDGSAAPACFLPAPTQSVAQAAFVFSPALLTCGDYLCETVVSGPTGELARASLAFTVAPALRPDLFTLGSWIGPASEEWLAFYETLGLTQVGAHDFGPDEANRIGRKGLFYNWSYYTAGGSDFSPANRSNLVAQFQAAAAPLAPLPNWSRLLLNDETGSGYVPGATARAAWFDAWAEPQLDFPVITNHYTVGTSHNPAGFSFPAGSAPGANGVFATNNLQPYLFLRWWLGGGAGFYRANALAAEAARALRPDVCTWTQPLSHDGQLRGLDAAGTWSYHILPARIVGEFEWAYAACRAARKPFLPHLGMEYVEASDWRTVTLPGHGGVTNLLAPTADDLIQQSWIATTHIPSEALIYWYLEAWFYGLRGQRLPSSAPATPAPYCEPGCDVALGAALKNDILPMGTLLRGVTNAQRRVALLLPETTLWANSGMGWSWGSSDHYPFAWIDWLRQMELPYDILKEADLVPGALENYQAVIFPMADYVAAHVSNRVAAAGAAGTRIIVDVYCRQSYPNLERWPQEYFYRRTSASNYYALVSNTISRLTNLAASVRQNSRAYAIGESGPLLLNTRHADGVDYVSVINDARRSGPYTTWTGHADFQPYGTQQWASVAFRAPEHGAIYDFTAAQRLATTLSNGYQVARVLLPPHAGKLFCVYPAALASLEVVAPTGSLGATEWIDVTLRDAAGLAAPGRQLVEVVIIDAAGGRHDESGLYALSNGVARIPLRLAGNDTPGSWSVEIRERTSGLAATNHFPVAASLSTRGSRLILVEHERSGLRRESKQPEKVRLAGADGQVQMLPAIAAGQR